MTSVDNLSLIFVLVFLAATLGIYAFYWFFIFNRREQSVINRRLQLTRQLRDASAVLATLRDERGIRNVSNPILRQAGDWLSQSGVNIRRRNVIMSWAAIGVALVIILSKVFGFGFASVALGVVATGAGFVFYLVRQRGQRISSFADQLPDAIDIIVRGVRVGLPLTSALALVAREMPDPVGTEFGMLADEIAFGLDIRSALGNLYRRVGQADLLFLTVSLSTQAQTGGNLAEVLSRLSQMMRNRANMRLKIRALSAEGRASAITLSAFPFAIFFLINFVSPAYYGAIRSNSIVQPAIYLGLLLLLVGNIIMYRMVNFKY
jgi:tight adherence protein B